MPRHVREQAACLTRSPPVSFLVAARILGDTRTRKVLYTPQQRQQEEAGGREEVNKGSRLGDERERRKRGDVQGGGQDGCASFTTAPPARENAERKETPRPRKKTQRKGTTQRATFAEKNSVLKGRPAVSSEPSS